jgi:hypothetical protein
MTTSIAENQNKILRVMHDIEEELGQSVTIGTKTIEVKTWLNPHQINTALALLTAEA